MQPGHFLVPDQFNSKKVKDLHARKIRWANPDTSVKACASVMATEEVSCLFIGDNPDQLIGFVTDITLRDQVLAKGISPDTPVKNIMETKLVRIGPEVFLMEALLLMFQTKSRYLLVQYQGRYVGWISRTKVLTEQSQGPLMFVQSVKEARQIPELKEKWSKMPEIIHQLISTGLKPGILNQIITSVADTITQRVIERVIKEIGPSPASFVFFVMGSEGRGELTLKTDQDNAIIYEDRANEHREEVRAYFLQFATKVSEGLNEIGFVFCEGELMAMNPKWTHSLSHWKKTYESWIRDASEETVMNYATFFDCRAVYGESQLLEDLKKFMDTQLQGASERFYLNLGRNALQFEPPLTFFRNIRTEKIDGEKQLNLKQTMRPIVDLARVYALKYRIFETNTIKRIEALRDHGVFETKESQELIHAFDYLMNLRLENQSYAILEYHLKPKNYLKIKNLTKVQQVTLIEIFKVFKEFQSRIKISFTRSL
jgi:CBS domain-containing protein